MTPLLAILLSILDLCHEPPSGVPLLPKTTAKLRGWRRCGTERALAKDEMRRSLLF